MIETNQAIVLWKRCLNIIKDNVQATAFDMWFKPIVPLKFENKTLTIGVPSPFFYEYLEEHFVDILREVIYKEFGEGTALMYSIMTDKTNGLEQNFSGGNHGNLLIINNTQCIQDKLRIKSDHDIPSFFADINIFIHGTHG